MTAPTRSGATTAADTPGRRFGDVRAQLADEHRRIMALVDRLRAHRRVAGLSPLLEELHGVLVNHFAREQFPGGLYECMGAFGSAWHDELRELIREHCVILSAARALLERSRASSERDDDALLAGVEALVESLNAHERKEHHLADHLAQAAGVAAS